MKITRAGNAQVPASVGHACFCPSVSSAYAVGIPRQNLAHKSAVKHYLLTDGYHAVLGAAYFADALASMDGVVYKIRWKDIESSLGVYSAANLDAAVSYVAARGKKLILRLWWKSYTDANDPPLAPPIPNYIVSDHTTYGGVSGSGGMRKVYTLPTWAGWGAMLENAAVYARFTALIDWIGSRYGSDVAFEGIGPDESIWGASFPLPAGLTTQNVIDTNKALLQRMQQAAPEKEVFQFANYLDDGTIDQVGDYISWGGDNGFSLGITDVLAVPQRASFMQHAYFNLPVENRRTLVCAEELSYGANDGTLSSRMDDNYRTAAMLGADIVAWSNTGGVAGAYWTHVLRVTGRT